MKIITTPTLSEQQKERVLQIWNTEYPVKLRMPGMVEFDTFLNTLINPEHYLMVDNDDVIIGWGNKYYIGDVTCFFIMISGEIHGKGYGTTLLNELKKGEKQLFGWAIDHNNDIKADGRPYPSPINFYIKNNFTINTERRLEDEQLSAVNILWEDAPD
ncbi:MAG: GNAT family N-acetyltransferase [Bacteroidota bacterium]|nr:GNAT family N-acetyltransferase [Bacteroidota bacterium]